MFYSTFTVYGTLFRLCSTDIEMSFLYSIQFNSFSYEVIYLMVNVPSLLSHNITTLNKGSVRHLSYITLIDTIKNHFEFCD